MNSEISCRFELLNAQLQEVEKISAQILGFMGDQGVSDGVFLSQIELATTEAINNAIEHGCCGSDIKQVSVTVTLTASDALIEIADPSSFTGLSNEPSLPINMLAERGRGLFIIAQFTDKVVHENRNGRHVLRLQKSLPSGFSRTEMGYQNRTLSKMTEELGASYEMISALIGLSELLAEAKDKTDFLKMALHRVLELTGADAVYLRSGCDAGLVLEGFAGELSVNIPTLLPTGKSGIESSVFLTGKEITVQSDLSGSNESVLKAPLCKQCRASLGSALVENDPLTGAVQAAFVTPILYKTERRGILVLAQSSKNRPFFTAVQMQVARVAGEYLGIASSINELQEKRESEQRALRELEIAAGIQMSLMPLEFRLSEKLDAFGLCQPAHSAGGDYFDFISLDDGSVFVICADVMGKGLSAALFANMLRTNILAFSGKALDPGMLLTEVNARMFPDLSRLDIFITALCVWISRDAGTIHHSGAGHPAGILRQKMGAISTLQSRGLPLGVLKDAIYETRKMDFERDSSLVLFSDGISETRDQSGNFFGDEGILAVVESNPDLSAEFLVKGIVDAVDQFSGNAPLVDDRSILAVLRKA